MLSDVPGTGIMAVYILKKWTKEIIFSPETSELIGRNETKHSTWQQQWFSSSEDNEELEENTWGEKEGITTREEEYMWESAYLKLRLHRGVGQMTSLSPAGSISCDGSSVSHPSFLISNYDICEASSSGKPNCKSCRAICFDEVCCWMLDHQHRWSQTPMEPPVSLQQFLMWVNIISQGKMQWVHAQSTCLTILVVYFQVVFGVYADSGRHRQGPSPWWWCWLSAVESVLVSEKSSILGGACYEPI